MYALDHKPVGKIRGRFFVPRYQRGYRWDTEDVKRLLDDIWACRGRLYNLQPIVVKLHKQSADENEKEWELIDGQQRLTTLYLIFLYIQKQGWKRNAAPYSIRYETRHGSEQYLTTLEPAKSDQCIDYFYLYQAYQCIGEWFKQWGKDFNQEHVASNLHSHLVEYVRIIWYEAPDHPKNNEKDSAALFARLNIGRIPLTDAELVKALLLSNNDRAKEVAAQWDEIERDLRDPNIWAFVAGVETSEEYPTRISLLLDALAPLPQNYPRGCQRATYHTFETLRGKIEKDREEFWQDVLNMHALVLGWFGEPRLHNKIGFLVATGTGFVELRGFAKELKKSEFEQDLIRRIQGEIKITASELLDLRYDNESQYSKLQALLLLMNVETVSRSGQHFPFRRHVGKTWSLEHIHAQNAESFTEKKQWKRWLEEHRAALNVLSKQHPLIEKIDAALARIDDSHFGNQFKNLASQVIAAFTEKNSAADEHDLHAITNLALLSRGDNSRLSNAVFEVKRQRILEIDRNLDGKGDSYVPVCTRNVFLKYYADADAQQIHFWSLKDRNSYFKAIVSTLKPYLKSEETAQ